LKSKPDPHPAVMPARVEPALTVLLQAWQQGDGNAFAKVFETVYVQLKQIAGQRLREGSGDTLSPTELLHEAVLRVVDAPMDWKNRAHFFATMSLHIRATLVDHARARHAAKRGGGELRVTLSRSDVGEESAMVELLMLDQTLKALELLDPRGSEVLHLTYFAGLDRVQIADVLGMSLSTVDRELRFARAWLSKALSGGV
jgi:RNA polymerase sigma factor (TIGR02999 family)